MSLLNPVHFEGASHDIYQFLHNWNVALKIFYIPEEGATSLCKFHCSSAAPGHVG